MDKLFKISQRGSTVKREIVAGLTTFMTMAYILAVNPSILADAGKDSTAVLLATAIASFIATVCMAFMANMPFALSAGMGLNAYFAYTVVLGMGYPWQFALLAVFAEGLIFIILSLTNVREAIFNAIPLALKRGVSVGIGLFIAFIGLQNAKVVVDSSTLVTITSFTENFSTQGITALLALVGLMLTAALHIWKVKGAVLIGIVATWALGIVCQLTGVYVPNVDAEFYSLIPEKIISVDFSKLGLTFGECFKIDFSSIKILDFIVVVFAFLFVDIFDTLGTLIGVVSKADMLDEEGRLPAIRPALLADAVGTTAGAVLGTSTVTTFVESASGVAAGGRTGLTALVTGALFLLSTLFAPLFTTIPSFATAPALIFVGFLMFSSIAKINLEDDLTDAIPAYITIIAMPMCYSISEGISLGIISYVILKLCTGKAKKVNWLMYVLAVLFILKYIFL
ncbi:MAG: NCS2 family permease [Oscillospiraceae bacterium]|nr:NCS2 family permease [Oscillospiraceae bacterium]